MANITVQQVAARMLKYIGVRQFAPEAAGSQLESVQPGDLDDIATAITGAMQEVFDAAPDEMREQRLGGLLPAPVTGTVSVSQYSMAISALNPFQAWMVGCTCQIQGDTQYNEIISQTALKNPYMGTTGSAGITIWGDCLTLDPTVDHVASPVELPNQLPLHMCNDRYDYLRWVGVPLVTDAAGVADLPFFYFVTRTVSRPRAWFAEEYFSPTAGQPVKRLRIAPMPDQAYPICYRAAMCPPRYVQTDICVNFDDANYDDPGTLIPVSNSWVETILLPVALQRFTAHPAFKNESAKTEIGRQYKQALALLTGASVSKNPSRHIRYL